MTFSGAKRQFFSEAYLERVIEVNSQIDQQQPLVPQVLAMADQCGLSPIEGQTLAILVNPPSLHWVAVTLLAEIHGRCGYFPAQLRLRPAGGTMSPQFEVAEVLDLQGVRDSAKKDGNSWDMRIAGQSRQRGRKGTTWQRLKKRRCSGLLQKRVFHSEMIYLKAVL